MKKNLSKTIAGTLVISTVLTSTTNKVEACDSAAILEQANQISMICPYAAPVLITGAAIITGVTTIIGIKQDTKEEVIYRSYTHLPDSWRPNSIVEKINPQGKCIQRRFYGQDGLPMFDVDMNNHGMPEAHPFGFGGAHKHIFNNKIRNKDRRRQKGVELTDEEYRKYIKEFDGKADRMKVRYIED